MARKKTSLKTSLKHRNIALMVHLQRNGAGSGRHQNRSRQVAKGRSRKVKHRHRDWR